MPQSLSSILIHLIFRVTFQDEYRKFLKRYGIDYDERYVWD